VGRVKMMEKLDFYNGMRARHKNVKSKVNHFIRNAQKGKNEQHSA
jgi:hypothetical protein